MLADFLSLSEPERAAVIASLDEEEAAALLADLEQHEIDNESILDFMQRVTPRWLRAEHFRLYTERMEKGVGGNIRLVFSAPPQHGKSECTLHGLAWAVQRYPGKRHAYITYNQKRSRSVSRSVKRILESAGIKVEGSVDVIRLPNGGQILFTSVDGGITGEPVDGMAIIDDPFKDRTEADSENRRETVVSAYRESIATRVHPGGSIFVLATRWHPQDLSGTLIEGEGWEYINLPAIAEAGDANGRAVGEPLFPAIRPLWFLEQQRRELLEFGFAALYQGRPRPKGGLIFHEPTYYTELPKYYRGGFGVDIAYTAKTSSDWSILVEMWREDRDEQDLLPRFYIIKVVRRQVEAPAFAAELVQAHQEKPAFRMVWRASGTEKGSADFIREQGAPLIVEQPPGDKLVSATDVAAAWNDGRVLVPDLEKFPEAKIWLKPFLTVVANFTGSGKETDDDVDGMGNAFEALKSGDARATTFKVRFRR